MERKRNDSRHHKENEVVFVACIPHEIDASLDDEWGPRLAGFPLNIAYVRGLNRKAPSKSQLETVLYWFDPETYREDSEHREMSYFKNHRNGYHVRVVFNKSRSNWQTDKFNGDTRICSAQGATFNEALMHTTLVGAEPDE
jgi:hypothetical protein